MANEQVPKMDDGGGTDSAGNEKAPLSVDEDEAASDNAGTEEVGLSGDQDKDASDNAANEEASTLVAFAGGEPTPGGGGGGGEVYDRDKAVAYARKFWDKPCSDGFIMVDSSKFFERVPAATKFVHDVMPSGTADREHALLPDGTTIGWSLLDDCTHFISCCTGQPPGEEAGGLKIRLMWGEAPANPYGISRVHSLVDYLLARADERKFTKVERAMIIGDEKTDQDLSDHLEPGDLIAYWNGSDYTHLAMYLGDNNIASHTYSRSDLAECTWDHVWDLGRGKFKWTFIHIK
jgi:hypothetical protein